MDTLTFGAHRLVHLDLKGAPPKLPYLEKFIPFVKDIGATGLLIEWEDTFPYTKELIEIGGLSNSSQVNNAPYSIEEARQILDLVVDSGLMVMPLIQTFGHMEFILKHEQWRHLREVEAYPSSLCPSSSEAIPLIKSLVKQIITFHPDIQYLHIGADEVWHLASCPTCVKRAQSSNHGKATVYLEHVIDVVQCIKENYPNLKLIIWDDMLRNIDESILQGYHLGNLVEPMIWHYNNAETFQLGEAVWEKYSNVFTNVWGATAFKGATSSCQILPINKYHISNHDAWLSELSSHIGKILNFRGIVLTGWSRYDHYATLCELLPCSLPTLCLCMKTWLSGGYSEDIHSSVSKMLGYTDIPLHMETPSRPTSLPTQLSFPGWQILVGFDWFLNIRTKYRSIVDSDPMNTWFNQWQILSCYTNPMQISSILPALTSLYMEIASLENYLKSNLEHHFHNHTIEELLGTLLTPIKRHVRQLQCDCETQLALGCGVRGQKRMNL